MKVKPRCEPKKVKVSGPAFSEKGVPASIPTDLIIDTSQAGFGDLEVQVMVSFVGGVFNTPAAKPHIHNAWSHHIDCRNNHKFTHGLAIAIAQLS